MNLSCYLKRPNFKRCSALSGFGSVNLGSHVVQCVLSSSTGCYSRRHCNSSISHSIFAGRKKAFHLRQSIGNSTSYGGGGGGNVGGSGNGGNGGNGGDGYGEDSPMRQPTYFFAFFLFGGGLAAYIRKGSSKSLMASSAVSILLLVSASLMGHSVGTWLALGSCLLLGGVMGWRATRSKTFFPAGLVSVLSLMMSAGYVKTIS